MSEAHNLHRKHGRYSEFGLRTCDLQDKNMTHSLQLQVSSLYVSRSVNALTLQRERLSSCFDVCRKAVNATAPATATVPEVVLH